MERKLWGFKVRRDANGLAVVDLPIGIPVACRQYFREQLPRPWCSPLIQRQPQTPADVASHPGGAQQEPSWQAERQEDRKTVAGGLSHSSDWLKSYRHTHTCLQDSETLITWCGQKNQLWKHALPAPSEGVAGKLVLFVRNSCLSGSKQVQDEGNPEKCHWGFSKQVDTECCLQQIKQWQDKVNYSLKHIQSRGLLGV